MTEMELTRCESVELDRAERTIESGLKTFIEVGNALSLIRDGRLYRTDYSTFEDYCRKRWGLGRAHANRLIAAADLVSEMDPIGSILPASESQARELVGLDPEQAAQVMEAATAEGPATATKIRKARKTLPQGDPPPHPDVIADLQPPPTTWDSIDPLDKAVSELDVALSILVGKGQLIEKAQELLRTYVTDLRTRIDTLESLIETGGVSDAGLAAWLEGEESR